MCRVDHKKKYKSMTQWKGLLCALIRCTFDVRRVFLDFFVYLRTSLQSEMLHNQNFYLLSEFCMITTVSVLNDLGVC